jgi:hypothetical protein
VDEDEKLDEQTAGAFGIASFYLMQSLMSALVEKDLFTMREIALIATAAAKNADDAVPTSPVPWLSPKRTAREVGDDSPDNEHTSRGNADQGGSEQQRHPSQSQNSDDQNKEGDADGPQPPNLDASTVVRAGGCPDPRRAWPVSTRRDDLRLGVGRLGLWHWLLLHHVIRMNVPESCGRWRPVDNEGMLSNLEGERVS